MKGMHTRTRDRANLSDCVAYVSPFCWLHNVKKYLVLKLIAQVGSEQAA